MYIILMSHSPLHLTTYPKNMQAHLATCIEERNRVIEEGGRIEWLVDTWRVAPAGLQVPPFMY